MMPTDVTNFVTAAAGPAPSAAAATATAPSPSVAPGRRHRPETTAKVEREAAERISSQEARFKALAADGDTSRDKALRELEAARADSDTVRRELAAAQEELASERKRGEAAAVTMGMSCGATWMVDVALPVAYGRCVAVAFGTCTAVSTACGGSSAGPSADSSDL